MTDQCPRSTAGAVVRESGSCTAFMFFEHNERTVLADIRTRETVAGTGDGCAALLPDALLHAPVYLAYLGAGNHDVDFPSFGLAGVITSGTGRKHVETIVQKAPHEIGRAHV